MLDLLRDYAIQQKLVVEPGFTPKSAQWAIELNTDGSFRGILPLEKSRPPFARCPELSFSEMLLLKNCAPPMLSNLSDVCLLTDAKESETEADVKPQAKHTFFVERMKEVAEAAPIFQPVALALMNPKTMDDIRESLRNQKAKPIDKATFFVDGFFPIDAPDWWDWWRVRRPELVAEAFARSNKVAKGAEQMVCFVTGIPSEPQAVHPKIKGLSDVGGHTVGDAFLSFDKSAFTSYGLVQSANAAVSEDAAKTYQEALNHLLKRSERLSGMRVAYWFDKIVPPEDNPFPFLFDGTTPDAATIEDALNSARKLLRRVKSGGEQEPLASCRYYALSLSGVSGRVMVRDWMTGSFEDLAQSVVIWFENLSITTLDGKTAQSPPLWRVISCALSPNETGDKGVGAIKIPLWKAALDSGRPIPDAAVNRILNLHRTFIVTGELDNAKRKTPLSTLYIRMGVLKASLIRKGIPMSPQLDPENIAKLPHKQKVAFQCGRLIAMLAALQREAIPDLDAGIAQRYYGAASTTPSLVIGRLIKLSQHHVAKLRSDPKTKGLSFWFDANIAEIVKGINNANEAAELPKTFNPEQQTLFALGYYQQIAENRTKKSDKPGAPPAEADPEPSENSAQTDAE